MPNYIAKTYIKRREWMYPEYEYYDNQDKEFDVKINKLI